MKIARRSFILIPAALQAQELLPEKKNNIGGSAPRLQEQAVVLDRAAYYGIQDDLRLEEQGRSDPSNNLYWWVNSGGYLFVNGRIGRTNFGELPQNDKWAVKYLVENPVDTDGGSHPQNIFRLITRNTIQSDAQEAYFRISKINLSSSQNRNASNGFLLMDRYTDDNNLYYSGIRVDGHVVIKKKINSVYYTLDERPLYPGKYDPLANPNLIPLNKWIGLRSVVTTTPDNKVLIQVYWDEDGADNWKLVGEAVDAGDSSVGGPAFLAGGRCGIRTDFMDAEFMRYQIFPAIRSGRDSVLRR